MANMRNFCVQNVIQKQSFDIDMIDTERALPTYLWLFVVYE